MIVCRVVGDLHEVLGHHGFQIYVSEPKLYTKSLHYWCRYPMFIRNCLVHITLSITNQKLSLCKMGCIKRTGSKMLKVGDGLHKSVPEVLIFSGFWFFFKVYTQNKWKALCFLPGKCQLCNLARKGYNRDRSAFYHPT